MAQYFKFKSLADLAAAAASLKLSLQFQEDLTPLWQPRRVGSFTVGNRLCIQPMEGCDGTLDGEPDELTYRRYERFGAGGAKLIWGEAAAIVPEGRANPRQLLLEEKHAASFERMLHTCQEAHQDNCGTTSDLLIGLQLTHSGRYSFSRPLLAQHDPLLDPRTLDKATGRHVDASYPLLSDDDLQRLEDRYVTAAKLAHRIGFQFVDLKQCHRYLLNELLAAKTRPGRYGGSLENRTRLVRNVLGRLRSEVPELLLATRLNVFDGLPFSKGQDNRGDPAQFQTPVLSSWGSNSRQPLEPDLTEPLQWIATMRDLGVQLVNVSLGNPYASPHLIRPFEYAPPDGYQTPEHPLVGVARHFDLTARVQEAFPDLAVVGSGYSFLQEFFPHAGAANVAAGRATFVGVGRASLAQPDFARQLLEHGRLDRKRTCRTFSYCTALMRAKHNELGQFPTGCPPFDKEGYAATWEEAKRTQPPPS